MQAQRLHVTFGFQTYKTIITVIHYPSTVSSDLGNTKIYVLGLVDIRGGLGGLEWGSFPVCLFLTSLRH